MSETPTNSPLDDDSSADETGRPQDQPTSPDEVVDEIEQLENDDAKVDYVGELPTDAEPVAGVEAVSGTPPSPSDPQSPAQAADWENELSPQRVGAELRRIEAEVRAIIDTRDSIRKRKLTGSSRWHELEEDIVSWQFSGRFEQSQIRRVRELIVQRNHLFDHLKFLASTRPTWNS